MFKTIAKFTVPDWEDKVNSGIGLSYHQPARVHRLAGRYENPMPLPESTISLSRGLWIWLLVFSGVLYRQAALGSPGQLHMSPFFQAGIQGIIIFYQIQRESTFLPWEKSMPKAYRSLQKHNTENPKQIFPGKELRGHSPNFHIHVSVSDFYIATTGLPILLQENMRTDPGNGKSLTDKFMWKLELRPRNSFPGHT